MYGKRRHFIRALFVILVAMELVVPIPEKVSLNKIYGGIHFRKRSAYKNDYHLAVKAANPKPYEDGFPAHVHYHFKVGGRGYDISNHAFMMKLVEDGLVASGVLPDDTQRYVSGITITAEKIGKNEDEVVVVELSPSLATGD